MNGDDARYQIQIIKLRLLSKEIGYKEARELAAPHLKTLNEKGRQIAKKYNRNHYPITFTGIMR